MIQKVIASVLQNTFILVSLIIILISLVYLPHYVTTQPYNGSYEVTEGVLIQQQVFKFKWSDYRHDLITYFSQLTHGSLGTTEAKVPVWEYLKPSLLRTLLLFNLSLILSLAYGLIKGIFDGLSPHKHGMVISLVMISLSDVFVILLLQTGVILLKKMGIDLFPVVADTSLVSLVLPLIALTFIPSNYLARTTSLIVKDIMTKPYMMTARGKGISQKRLIFIHLFRNLLTDISTYFQTISLMLFSSMLLVEYLFSYPGLATMMFDHSKEMNIFVGALIFFVLLNYFYNGLFKILHARLKVKS